MKLPHSRKFVLLGLTVLSFLFDNLSIIAQANMYEPESTDHFHCLPEPKLIESVQLISRMTPTFKFLLSVASTAAFICSLFMIFTYFSDRYQSILVPFNMAFVLLKSAASLLLVGRELYHYDVFWALFSHAIMPICYIFPHWFERNIHLSLFCTFCFVSNAILLDMIIISSLEFIRYSTQGVSDDDNFPIILHNSSDVDSAPNNSGLPTYEEAMCMLTFPVESDLSNMARTEDCDSSEPSNLSETEAIQNGENKSQTAESVV